jgi:tetratricopeptide (TPR) repeat protein
VVAYPTFILLDAQGEVVSRGLGYDGPEAWSGWLLARAADPVPLGTRRSRHEQDPSFGDALELGLVAMAEMDGVAADGYLREAIVLDPEAAAAASVPHALFRATSYGARNGQFDVARVCAVAREVLVSGQLTPCEATDVFRRLERFRDAVDDEELAALLRLGSSAVAACGDEDFARARGTFLVDYALLVDGDPAGAVALKRSQMPAGWMSSARHLNSFAWWCFEHDVNLAEGTRLARQAVEIAGSDEERANILDTLAELLNRQGRVQEAAETMRRAVELAPENAYLQEQLDRFEKAAG